MTEAADIVEVAVAVLFDKDGRFLMGSRPEGKVYAGYWEFPGGKIEPGEDAAGAVRRELFEELGLTVGSVDFFLTKVFAYPHATVRLHFCRSSDWSGLPTGREGQKFGFFTLEDLPDPILPATKPIMQEVTVCP